MSAPDQIRELAARLVERASVKSLMIATAESCTGGMVGAAITDISGASAVLDRGFVTYSNEAKMEMLGVRKETLMQWGAVSEEVAREMADGALSRSRAAVAVAITGVAGPTGGSAEKPVGLVWIALARKGAPTQVERHVFSGGDRDFVRDQATETALRLLLKAI